MNHQWSWFISPFCLLECGVKLLHKVPVHVLTAGVQGQVKAWCSHKVEGRLIVAGADDAAHSDVAAPEPFQTIQK
jgi:hypothetical protein